MYVRRSYNVFPVEIENALSGDRTVAMSAVIGGPDDLYGEVGHAHIVPTPGTTIAVDTLFDRCREQLAKYNIPARIHVVTHCRSRHPERSIRWLYARRYQQKSIP
jgi:fatty-acyl-CoA synthase